MKTIYTGRVLYQKGAVTKVIKGPLSIVINVAILEAPLIEKSLSNQLAFRWSTHLVFL